MDLTPNMVVANRFTPCKSQWNEGARHHLPVHLSFQKLNILSLDHYQMFQYLAKRLAGKNVSEIAYFCVEWNVEP